MWNGHKGLGHLCLYFNGLVSRNPLRVRVRGVALLPGKGCGRGKARGGVLLEPQQTEARPHPSLRMAFGKGREISNGSLRPSH